MKLVNDYRLKMEFNHTRCRLVITTDNSRIIFGPSEFRHRETVIRRLFRILRQNFSAITPIYISPSSHPRLFDERTSRGGGQWR